MFNITNHQRNANQNHKEILSHTHHGGYYQKKKITSVGEVVGNGMAVSEKIKYRIMIWSSSSITQLVKNLPAMRETCVQSLGHEDPLEKEKATHSSILVWRIP